MCSFFSLQKHDFLLSFNSKPNTFLKPNTFSELNTFLESHIFFETHFLFLKPNTFLESQYFCRDPILFVTRYFWTTISFSKLNIYNRETEMSVIKWALTELLRLSYLYYTIWNNVFGLWKWKILDLTPRGRARTQLGFVVQPIINYKKFTFILRRRPKPNQYYL